MNENTNTELSRRMMLGAMGVGGVSLAGMSVGASARPMIAMPLVGAPLSPEQMGWDAAKGEFVLPALPYAPEAMEPHIDAETMTIHHTKHHASYVAGLNKALKGLASVRDQQAEPWQIKYWSRELAFNGGGHVNHSLFWQTIAPAAKGGGGQPSGGVSDAIKADFGGFEKFVGHFKEAAKQVEGSGWAWLALHKVSGKLLVVQGEKQQDFVGWGATPIMGIDVWEHAYYLKYKNDRAAYVNAFMNIINWAKVGELYEAVKTKQA